MKKSRIRLGLCITLLCANLAFIWGNSLLPDTLSAALSRFIGSLLGGEGTGADGSGDHLLRKLAHFFEFASLGFLLAWLMGMYQRKPWYALLPGVAAACVDESIQIFVPGRGPRVSDVGIDSLGICLGIVLIYFMNNLYKLWRKRK